MSITWYQRNDAAVIGALQRGQRPDMATTQSSGPLDELVALHDELGVFEVLDAARVPKAETRGGRQTAAAHGRRVAVYRNQRTESL